MNNKKPDYANDNVRAYRRGALKIARELCYSDDVLRRIRNAKTTEEISRIMRTARKES